MCIYIYIYVHIYTYIYIRYIHKVCVCIYDIDMRKMHLMTPFTKGSVEDKWWH